LFIEGEILPNAIIFLNGEIGDPSFYRNLVKEGDSVFCADGGAEHARCLGLSPRLIIGDLDSADGGTIRYFESHGAAIERFSPEKDETDAQLLISRIAAMDFEEILICGALGGRTDHSVANIFLLERFSREGKRIAIVSPEESIELILSERLIDGCVGKTVSLLSLDEESHVSISGFKYPLNGILKRGESLGISNIVMEEHARVEVSAGAVLMIITEDVT
jgi:thiamine pyrophosphokinase